MNSIILNNCLLAIIIYIPVKVNTVCLEVIVYWYFNSFLIYQEFLFQYDNDYYIIIYKIFLLNVIFSLLSLPPLLSITFSCLVFSHLCYSILFYPILTYHILPYLILFHFTSPYSILSYYVMYGLVLSCCV